MIEKLKIYAKITNLWAIARRYFVNNFYDGMLTVLGVLLGFFVIILKESQPSIDSNFVILTGMGSSISMFFSGMTGSYLSERAERKKIKDELRRAMVISEVEEALEDEKSSVIEIEKAMLTKLKHIMNPDKRKNEKKPKTIQEKAQSFASLVVSFVNGGSPFLGGVVPLIPFLFVTHAHFLTFILSFLIILFCIILLGIFLGIVSKESILKNILQMAFAFLLTLVISIFLLG
ncbi:MAG: VIT1/CCC1 transporter family protein [Promethearchaeota archaeon]